MNPMAITQEGEQLFNIEDIVNYVCDNLLEGTAIDLDADINRMDLYIYGKKISIEPHKVSFDVKHDLINQTTFNIEMSLPINTELCNMLEKRAMDIMELTHITIRQPNSNRKFNFEDAFLEKLEIEGERKRANLTFVGTEMSVELDIPAN